MLYQSPPKALGVILHRRAEKGRDFAGSSVFLTAKRWGPGADLPMVMGLIKHFTTGIWLTGMTFGRLCRSHCQTLQARLQVG